MSKRSKQEVSSVVSGAGLLATIWVALTSAVRKLGGNDECIHRLATPEGADTVENIAHLIVGKPTETAIAPNWWSKMLEALVKACGFTYRNNNINAENFPCNSEPGQVEIVSIKERLKILGKAWLRTDEVLAYLSERGYRPATLMELLLWWLANPAKHVNCLVVALGQVWRGLAPYVDGYGGARSLGLDSVEDGWHECFGFAVVRKSA